MIVYLFVCLLFKITHFSIFHLQNKTSKQTKSKKFLLLSQVFAVAQSG